MRLDEYLAHNKIRRYRFAERVGTSRSTISGIILNGQWPSRDLAIRIRQETGGHVTPNDFLPPFEIAAPPSAAGLPFVDTCPPTSAGVPLAAEASE